MHLLVSTKPRITSRQRAGYRFNREPQVVDLDPEELDPTDTRFAAEGRVQRTKLQALKDDADPVHGGLVVREITAAEARRHLGEAPEADADVPRPLAAEMADLRRQLVDRDARISELEAELAAAQELLDAGGAGAEGEGDERPPRGKRRGSDR